MDIKEFVAPHILGLKPYSNARSEFKGRASVWLDANENPFDQEFEDNINRYPDPLQGNLKSELAKRYNVAPNQIFVGNGSDEAIDLLIRLFCVSGRDKIVVQPPTYSMYAQTAAIQNVESDSCPLRDDFQADLSNLKRCLDDRSAKLVFFCSPNNPTGNDMNLDGIREILAMENSIVVVDEAYAEFSDQTALDLLEDFDNLVVMRTLSKAYGMAGLRVGVAVANSKIIDFLNTIKPPYNVNQLSQLTALTQLQSKQWEGQIKTLVGERDILLEALGNTGYFDKVYPSQANFILVQTKAAQKLYQFLSERGIVIRNRNGQVKNALRITVGTKQENAELLKALKQFYNE